MKLRLAILALVSAACGAQTIRPFPAEPNKIVASHQLTKEARREVLVGRTDQVFPHIATGGSWETVIVVVNISPNPMVYKQFFYDQSGQPMRVTFRTYPELEVVTDTGIVGSLPPGASFNFALFDATPELQVGWGTLQYDSSAGRLGAYAIFRQRVPGRPAFEALVPLSAYDDTRFYMPFDNIQGFVTAIALTNPASNLDNVISVTAVDLKGNVIFRDALTLPKGGQTAFVLTEKWPQLAERMGTMYFESNLTRLAAMGIRFNSSDGWVFSSIPIMNWSEMF